MTSAWIPFFSQTAHTDFFLSFYNSVVQWILRWRVCPIRGTAHLADRSGILVLLLRRLKACLSTLGISNDRCDVHGGVSHLDSSYRWTMRACSQLCAILICKFSTRHRCAPWVWVVPVAYRWMTLLLLTLFWCGFESSSWAAVCKVLHVHTLLGG